MAIPPAVKRVFHNGVFVGEVPNMGNLYKDYKVSRELLLSKRLLKDKPSLVHAMFRQAVSFTTTACYLYERDLTKVPRNGLSVVPFVVNTVFGIELYLKTLGQLRGRPSGREHKLLTLYKSLPDEAHALIDNYLPAAAAKRTLLAPFDLLQTLIALNNAFVEWRYSYESHLKLDVPVQEAIVLGEALHDACRICLPQDF